MAITNGYCSLDQLKAYAIPRGGGSATTDTADDAVMEDIVEQVSRYLDSQTGRRFYANSVDETRYFQTSDSYECEIDDLSAAPTSISVDYTDLRSYTALDSGDYELDPVNALLDGKPYTTVLIAPNSDAYFPHTRRGVRIVGKFGFPSIPDEIKNLALAISLNVYQARSGQSSAGNVTVTASGIVIRPQDVPAWGQQVMMTYRKYL